ncbi:MAG: hypothetical protein IJM17_08210 [Firmicutes bacterium]|nr:hypothetical protein [Bacillota bacterium]
MKKILSLSLILILLLSSFPAEAFASVPAGFDYAGDPPSMYIQEHQARQIGEPTLIYGDDGAPIFEVYTLMVEPDCDLKKEVNGETKYYRYSPKIATSYCENHYDVWHTSSAQWKIGATGKIVDDDDIILESGSITNYLEENVESIDFIAEVPAEVRNALNENRFKGLTISAAENIETDSIATITPYGIPHPWDTSFQFSIKPKFNLRMGNGQLMSYEAAGGNMNLFLMDIICGFNLWAIYDSGGRELGQGKAMFSYGDGGMSSEPGAVQLAEVIDEGGRLKSGYRISCVKNDVTTTYDTAGLRIGSGEGIYMNGGAIGYSFRYIFKLTWTYDDLVEIPQSEYIFEKAFPLVKQGDTRTFRVTYRPGEGSGTMTGPNEYRPGELVTVLENEFIAPEGKEFAYFSTFGGLLRVLPGETYRIPCDVTLTAMWQNLITGAVTEDGPADAFADLILPPVGYEGHAVFARDDSTITVGGEEVGLVRAYSEGLASNTFTAEGADTAERESLTEMKLIYDTPGSYDVTLKVDTDEGSSSDTETIDILKTPSVSAVLGGKRKENRRQTLDVVVAQNPAYPINSLNIRISESESGESISVSKNFSGPEPAPENTGHIKYRSLTNNEVGSYYVSVRLEFLTKFSEEKSFTYEIEAEDPRGSRDVVISSFTVVPDEAPDAAVELAEVYYRESSSNIAKISMRDASTADGDQLRREWSIAEKGDGNYGPVNGAPGFADESFGSLLSVCFSKTGVGYFDVSLKVTDVWTEETLPEYISPDDYKWAAATARSHVDNIPPEVLLTLKKAKTAEILLLSSSSAEEVKAKTEAEAMRIALLKESVAAEVKTLRIADPDTVYTPNTEIRPLTDSDLEELKSMAGGSLLSFTSGVADSPFWGDKGGSVKRADTLNEKSAYTYELSANTNITSDGIYVFRMRSSLEFARKEEVLSSYDRTYPFTLECWDLFANAPQKIWSVSITPAVFSSPDGLKNARLTVNEGGNYVFLSEEGKTLVIDKRTGSFITTIGIELGDTVFEGNGSIYALKSDGIYRLAPSGVLSKIRNLSVQAGYEKAAFYKGRLNFVTERGLTLYRSIFDPVTEELLTELLPDSAPPVANSALKGVCAGVDSAGTIAIRYDSGTVKFYENGAAAPKTLSVPGNFKGIKSVTAVRDGYGLIKGAAVAAHVHSHTVSGNSTWDTNAYYLDMQSGAVIRKTVRGSATLLYACGADHPAEAYYENGRAYVTYGPSYGNSTYNMDLPETNIDYPAGTFIFNIAGGEADFRSDRKNQRFAARAGNLTIQKRAGLTETECAVRTLSFGEGAMEEQLKLRELSLERDYSASFSVDSLFDGKAAALEMSGRGETLASLSLKTKKSDGYLTRSLALESGRTYYYEYDTDAGSDILYFTKNVERPSDSASPKYRVIAEFTEDFKDLPKGIFSWDSASVTAGSGRGCTLSKNTAPISFTVPEGRFAILSFDYEYPLGAKTPEVTIEKDGEKMRWNIVNCGKAGGAARGTYIHDGLLSAGIYSIGSDLKLSVNSITLSLVDQSAEQVGAGLMSLAKESSVETGASLNRISGSFETGPGTLSFETSGDAVRYSASPNGTYTMVNRRNYSGGGYIDRLTYTLPQGMKAVWLKVNTVQSAPEVLGDTRYALEAAAYDLWLDGGEIATEYYDRTVNVPRGQTAFSFTLKGSELYSASASGRGYISSYVEDMRTQHAGISGIDMIFAPAGSGSALSEGHFAVIGNDVIVPGASAGGPVSLSFIPGKTGTTVISGLRIWYVENGERIYVSDTAFTEESYLSAWTAVDAQAAVVHSDKTEEEPKTARVYKKGQTVIYSFSYFDYEADPEKQGFFRYTHEPMNDGLNPISGQILTSSVPRFYVDGKYTVEHWAVDRAGRDSGIEDYDYASNVATAVFYIEGSLPENEAPYVRTIRTSPGSLRDGDAYNILVTVGDTDGDVLTVRTELYYEDGSSPVYSSTKTGITPNSGGVYSELIFTGVPDAREGGYEAVVTVSDGTASSIKSYTYVVRVRNSLSGAVTHTDDWENNRQTYNFNNFRDRGRTYYVSNFNTYRNQALPRKRGTNVFWAGEALVLEAPVEGTAVRVTARLSGTSYSAVLSRSGSLTQGEHTYTVFSGELWDRAMINSLAQNGPEQRSVVFTAVFEDGESLSYTADIIFDDDDPYWMLHRAY